MVVSSPALLILLTAGVLAANPSELILGRNAFRARDFSAAIPRLRAAVKQTPAGIEARVLLVRALIETAAMDEALTALEPLSAPQATAEARFQAGQLLQEMAARKRAALNRVAPDSAEADELAGNSLELAGRLDEALARYQTALRKAPQRTGLHFLIGNIYYRKRELPRAEAELKQELERNPFHAQANLRLGEVLLAADRAAEAIAPLERAREALPRSAAVHRELGKAYRQTERVADAITEWVAAEQMNPNDDQVHYLLGTLYREQGRTAEARREFEAHRELLQRRKVSAERKP